MSLIWLAAALVFSGQLRFGSFLSPATVFLTESSPEKTSSSSSRTGFLSALGISAESSSYKDILVKKLWGNPLNRGWFSLEFNSNISSHRVYLSIYKLLLSIDRIRVCD